MNDPVSKTRDTYDAIGAEFLENTRDRSEMRGWLDRFASALPAGTLVLDLGADLSVESGLWISPTLLDRERYERYRRQERPLVMAIEREGVPL